MAKTKSQPVATEPKRESALECCPNMTQYLDHFMKRQDGKGIRVATLLTTGNATSGVAQSTSKGIVADFGGRNYFQLCYCPFCGTVLNADRAAAMAKPYPEPFVAPVS